MNILFINYYYYPNLIGGAEHSIKLLAEGLISEGHKVAVYTHDSKVGSEREMINGVIIYRGKDVYARMDGKICYLKKGLDYIWNQRWESELYNILIAFKPEIVNVNNLFYLSPAMWKYCSCKGIKVIQTLRDYALLDPTSNWEHIPHVIRIIYNNIYIKIGRYLSNKYVTGVTSPSHFTLNQYINQGYFKNSYHSVIPNSIYLDLEETKQIIEIKRDRTASEIKLLYVGTLNEKKGLLNLLKAFEQIESPLLSLTICGTGILKSLLLEYSKRESRIKYLGQLSPDQLKKQYIEADVLIIPSIWEEPFGRIVIEGNQYGLPVICSNRGGIVEIMQTMHSGVVFIYDSIEDLISKINKMSHRDTIKSYYPQILSNITYYDNAHNVAHYIECYKRVLNSKE